MNITEKEKQELEEIYQRYLHEPKLEPMKKIPNHNGSNIFLHTFRVTKLAMKKALRRKEVNLKDLLMGCILHDYYLYDWRIEKGRLKGHGKKHPCISIENADRDFGINDATKKIIESHMWPINFKVFPATKEARLLSIADKIVATREFLTSKKHKEKRMDKYFKKIEYLFD